MGEERLHGRIWLGLAGFRGVGKHLVVNVQGGFPIAQFFRRFAVPHVSKQADFFHAIGLEEGVEGVGRGLQRLFAIRAFRIISLGEVIIDQCVLESVIQNVCLKLLLPGQDVAIGLFLRPLGRGLHGVQFGLILFRGLFVPGAGLAQGGLGVAEKLRLLLFIAAGLRQRRSFKAFSMEKSAQMARASDAWGWSGFS